MKTTWGGVAFDRIAEIRAVRDARGALVTDSFSYAPDTQLNAHGAGPFCRFEVAAPATAGVYCLTVDGSPVYVGECANLARRFGPIGYGQIFRRNTLADGQATNCKVNHRVLQAVQAGRHVELWFHETADFKRMEAVVLGALSPAWNGSAASIRRARLAATSRGGAATRAAARAPASTLGVTFRDALARRFQSARVTGLQSIRVNSGDLHREVGGYPGRNHKMPLCCDEMRAAIRPGDRIIAQPPKGRGASLTIEYVLPR